YLVYYNTERVEEGLQPNFSAVRVFYDSPVNSSKSLELSSNSARISSAVTLEAKAVSSSVSAANISVFCCCKASTFSSMEPLETIRQAMTFLSWPIRWARSSAWDSTAGFHHGSNRNT